MIDLASATWYFFLRFRNFSRTVAEAATRFMPAPPIVRHNAGCMVSAWKPTVTFLTASFGRQNRTAKTKLPR